MKTPVVVHNLTAAQAQQMKLLFEIDASVVLVPDEDGTFTLVATYPDDAGEIPAPPPAAPPPPPPPAAPPPAAKPAAPPPTAPGGPSPFVNSLLAICSQEWGYFGRQEYDINGTAIVVGHKEQQPGYASRIGTYWKVGTNTDGIDGTKTDWPWSAAFISWAMKTAGAGDRFRYSTKHSVYIAQAIRDRISGRQEAGYWCQRLNEYQPQPGDVMCWAREPGIDYDNQKQGWYDGHCDIIVQVTKDHVWVIGGNIGNSVTKRPFARGADGFLSPIVVNGENLFGIMQCRIDQAAKAAGDVGLPAMQDAAGQHTIAWGKVLSPQLKSAVIGLATKLGCDPSHLTACMAFETGETFSPTKQNPLSQATGLIQFMPATALSLGTSINQLLGMSAVQQMAYVEKYFLPYAGRLNGLSDVYMAILWPAAVGKNDASALFVQGTKYYSQNSGLDVNNDGVVTKGEAASKPQGKLDKGLMQGLIG